MCCGWSEIPISQLDKAITHKLEIHGGSPKAEVTINKEDIRAERSGLNLFKKVMTKTITSFL